MHDSRSVSLSPDKAFTFYHKPPSHHPLSVPSPRPFHFPTQRQCLIQERCFVLVCSTTWQSEAGGFMRTLLLMFEVHGVEITTVSTKVHLSLLPPPGGDKLPSPPIKHPSSCSNWDPWTSARAVSHLLSCWYHSNDSLGKD